ncbi:glycosyltransferase [Streptosporangium carneum]|uniref:dolichyl-phosphate beta-glucosyltransferase n=1 Tax=Streptosporangium carneum TaxID=47481 RepID=A0A9W6MI95_9ACTN|nr:glycosyltransferase [Streptosporangium carneum]GLK15012.1 polysaccharide synthesis protein GtrA [Streptosporangium carneum]
MTDLTAGQEVRRAREGEACAACELTTTVEIVVPVHNEERALSGCVEVLRDYLKRCFPFEWIITVVDNASTDRTPEIAAELTRRHRSEIRLLRLERKGRGLALRTAWARSRADVVVYMDVDLSTGLDALLPLVAPLLNGHSDLAVGSRLARGARTLRGPRREIISRCYNALVRLTHGVGFTDTQCGFKAARTAVVRPLLATVEDDSWFFDTELLLLADHNGLRVHEIPVDWVEDVDSRVQVVRTAVDDVKGLIRVARAKATGAARVPDLPARPDPRAAHPDAVLAENGGGLLWQLLSFGVIGVLSTAAHLGLYALLRTWLPLLAANLAALTLTTVLNTEANRRFTFVASRERSTARTHLLGLIVFGLYYALTSGALLTLTALVPGHTRVLELTVLVCACLLGTASRFLLLRGWVFGHATAPRK